VRQIPGSTGKNRASDRDSHQNYPNQRSRSKASERIPVAGAIGNSYRLNRELLSPNREFIPLDGKSEISRIDAV
jgi:hypothetical protein